MVIVAPEPKFDVVTLGRICVDLYAQQSGVRLDQASSFARAVGGCAGNIAIGCARLGLRAAIVTATGADSFGAYVKATLEAENVATRGLRQDAARCTALAFASAAPGGAPDLVFFRENAADAVTEPAEIDTALIVSARALVVSGAHAASGIGADAVDVAITAARDAARSVVLDIDHRPSFGTPGGAAAVASRLTALIEAADVVVGTEEEWRIAGNAGSTIDALLSLRARSGAVFVVKRGSRGSVVLRAAIPARLDAGGVVPGFSVALCNPLGAGDAFMAGFIARYLEGAAPEDCARHGNACGAIVAARLLCSAASPTTQELAAFLAGAPASANPPRATAARNAPATILALALDHRAQFAALATHHGRDARAIATFKSAGCAAMRDLAATDTRPECGFGVLLDRDYGAAALDSLTARPAPLWIGVPVERPGSRPLAFEAGRDLGSALIAWPETHVVKCLALYHPDDPPELRAAQDVALVQTGEAARRLGRALLIELVASPFGPVGEATLADTLAHLYALGLHPDWWKLEMQSAASWRRIEAVIRHNDPDCRGVLVLGRDAGDDDLANGIATAAAAPIVAGFAIGRAIWQEAAERFCSGAIDEAAARDMMIERFRAMVSLWWRNRGGLVS